MTSIRGKRPSSALFKEWNESYGGIHEVTPIYSIEEFHNTFIELGDLTEYSAALQLVGSWEEWNRLKTQSAPFKEELDKWKNELKVKMESDAQRKVVELLSCGKSSVELSAAKFLSSKDSAGRPTKAQIENKQRELAREANITVDELTRVKEAMSETTGNSAGQHIQ